MTRSIATILAAGLILASPVRAADPMEEAKVHVANAKVHYDLSEFVEAAEEYILVYRIKPIPAILYNIAQAYRQGGKYQKARQFYQSYLRATEDPKVQATVKKAIKEIDELLAKEDKTKSLQPTGVTEPPAGSMASKKEKDEGDAALGPPGAAASKAPDLAPPDGPGTKPSPPKPADPAVAAKPPAARPAEPSAVAAKVPEPAPAPLVPPAGPSPSGKPAAAASMPPAATAPAPGSSKPAGTVVATASAPPAPGPGAKAAPAPATTSAPTLATTRPAAPSVSEESGGHTLAWIAGGTAVALLGGGAFFAVSAGSTDSQITSGSHTRLQVDDLISQSKSKHLLGAILLGAGAVAAAGCAVLFLF